MYLTLKTEARQLEVRLTDSERRQRADQAAEKLAEAKEKLLIENNAKRVAKLAKEDRENLEGQAAELLATYRRGSEVRAVHVRHEFDRLDVVLVRTDTEEEIERRKPTEEDWNRIRNAKQTRLAFEAAEKVAEVMGATGSPNAPDVVEQVKGKKGTKGKKWTERDSAPTAPKVELNVPDAGEAT